MMKIAIIGAGFAGLASAKVLGQLGYDVTVFDKTPDVGGVWSRMRRYPGLRTQNPKATYRFSDHPMPRDFPQWLEGAQVQQYLEGYVERFGLQSSLRLETEVIAAVPIEGDDGWLVTTRDGSERYDHLVVANGIFSEPLIPDFEGVAQLATAGGRLIATSELSSLDEVRGRNVLMVGYGKSSCDVAVEVSKVAASTTVVARGLLWKVPRRLKGVVNYKYLLLTRLGEGLFPYQVLRGAERLLHARESAVPKLMLESVEKIVTSQLRLASLDLVPDAPFESIAPPIESVHRGLMLLKVLRDGRVLGVKEAATLLGVAPSSAHRLLSALCFDGFAVQDRDRQYRLGPELQPEQVRGLDVGEFRTLVHSVIERLSQTTGETVHVWVRQGPLLRWVDGVAGPAPSHIAPDRWDRVPAYASAAGKALLSELNNSQLEEVFAGGLPPARASRLTSLQSLKRHLQAVRARGYAISIEESAQGVDGIAVCSKDAFGRPIFAISLAIPSSRFERTKVPEYVEALRHAVDQTEEVLAGVRHRDENDHARSDL